MLRATLVLASAILAFGPALAQEAAPGQGRYQIMPDGDGFVRFDSETGALAHCARLDGVWRCASVAEDRAAVDDRVVALREEMAMLRAEMQELGQRLAAIEEGTGSAEQTLPDGESRSAEPEEQEVDEALSLAERMMQRFFDMIRELKSEQAPQQI